MGGAPLLLALAVVTVDAGWESDGRDGYRYIIQLPAEQLREIERTGQVTSQIPEELRGRIHSVVIQIGDDPLPRPAVEPLPAAADAEPPPESPADSPPTDSSESAELAAAGPASIYLPSPDETVRAQGADDFSMPSMQNSYGTSDFRGFNETQSRATNAPSTSASSSDAPSTSRGTAAGTSGSATGFAAADAPRDNRWNLGPTSGSGGSANGAAATTQPGASQPGSPSGATPSGSSATPPSAFGSSAGSTQTGGASSPASSGNANAANSGAAANDGSSAGSASSWAMPPASSSAANSSGSANTASPSTPPSLATPQNSPHTDGSGSFADASAGGRDSSSPNGLSGSAYGDGATTADSRQELADRRLLEEVGINASGHAYDRRTKQLLYEDDPRYPLIVDYVRRTERAEQDRLRARDAAPARPPAAVPSRPLYSDVSASDYAPPASRGSTPGGSDAWGQWGYDARTGSYSDRNATAAPGGYAPTPGYAPNPLYGAYPPQGPGGNSVPPSAAPSAGWPADPRLAQNPPAQNPPAQTSAAPTTVTTTSSAAEPRQPPVESTAVASNEVDQRSRESKSREPSVTAQPLFNFMLLLSIVGNIYLGIAISRLIRRYRNLVSTQRGTAITA